MNVSAVGFGDSFNDGDAGPPKSDERVERVE